MKSKIMLATAASMAVAPFSALVFVPNASEALCLHPVGNARGAYDHAQLAINHAVPHAAGGAVVIFVAGGKDLALQFGMKSGKLFFAECIVHGGIVTQGFQVFSLSSG